MSCGLRRLLERFKGQAHALPQLKFSCAFPVAKDVELLKEMKESCGNSFEHHVKKGDGHMAKFIVIGLRRLPLLTPSRPPQRQHRIRDDRQTHPRRLAILRIDLGPQANLHGKRIPVLRAAAARLASYPKRPARARTAPRRRREL